MRHAAVTLALALAAACSRAPSADLVAYGRVWTGDPAAPWAQAVASRGDTIVAVGDSVTVAPLVGEATRVLRGAMVVPGFMDGHVHFLDAGHQLASVDLRDAASPEEFVARLKAFAAERKPGEWILGGKWDHESWPGGPLPRREWIDSVTPNNPVFVERLDGHMGLANSAALKAAGITRASPDIPGGTIVRDARTGEPTGVLKDEAMGPVYRVIPPASPEQDDAALARAMQHANARGVTAVASVSSPWSELAAFRRARAAGTQTVRVALYPSLALWRAVADSVAASGPGDDWIRLAGVKGYVDGSLGSGTALFDEPYADDRATTGLLVTPEDSLRQWTGAADSAGLQVIVHAIGERANRVMLGIFDSVATAHGPRDRRFRIEHAQHLQPADVPRFAASGVLASMQPFHAADDGRWAHKRLGPVRIRNSYVFRSLLDAKARVAFGSDWPVAPIDPLWGIWAAVSRRTLDDRHPEGWIPEQKISVEEALAAYTGANAWGVFAEARRGALAAGKAADFVVLDRDLTRVEAEQIRTATVLATVAGGRVVHETAR